MRAEFARAVEPLLAQDPDSLFITGDLGYRALEGIREKLGKRFLNAGVAEQNMMSMAAGTALAGFRPWVYSIVPFVTYRCLEQIRNDVCFHGLPVKIVGNGGGYTYGIMGSTHHGLEDLAMLKALPNIRLYFPCARDQVEQATLQVNENPGPSYLRLAVSPYDTPLNPLSENRETLTRQYCQGKRVTVIGVGHASQIALSALKDLRKWDVDLFSVSRFPFDLKADHLLVNSVKTTKRVIVIEEHYEAGGIGESLKSQLPNTDFFQILCPFYFKEQRFGTSRFHLKQCKVTPENLVSWVEKTSTHDNL